MHVALQVVGSVDVHRLVLSWRAVPGAPALGILCALGQAGAHLQLRSGRQHPRWPPVMGCYDTSGGIVSACGAAEHVLGACTPCLVA